MNHHFKSNFVYYIVGICFTSVITSQIMQQNNNARRWELEDAQWERENGGRFEEACRRDAAIWAEHDAKQAKWRANRKVKGKANKS